jgi:hypothetical protein
MNNRVNYFLQHFGAETYPEEPRYLTRYSYMLWAGRPGFDSLQGKRYFSYPHREDRVWGPTQPPIHWVPGASFPGVSGNDTKLTTHFHLVPRPRMV